MSRYDMRIESSYDAIEIENRDEDRRQALFDGAEEAEREFIRPCPEYWASLDNPDDAYLPGDPKRSDFLDAADLDTDR